MAPNTTHKPTGTALHASAVLAAEASWCLTSGLVVDVSAPDHIRVDVNGRISPGRRAASCLLEPALGDRVLVAQADSEAYIVAVLERPGPSPASLSANVPSDLLEIHEKKISITSVERLNISTPAMTIHTQVLSLFSEATSLVGKLLTQALQKWQLSSRAVDIVSDDIGMQAARRTTVIAETDVLKAEVLVQNIASTSVTNAHSAVVAVKEDLRLDGERVTIG